MKDTLREFINKHSKAAWISFNFKLDGRYFSSTSVDDFILDYGRKSEQILDDYVVLDYTTSYPSQSQGSVYFLTIQNKKEYEEENKEVIYTKGQSDLINKYYRTTIDCLIGDAVIMSSGSGWDAMEVVIGMINKLSEKDKNKIRSLVLGYKY